MMNTIYLIISMILLLTILFLSLGACRQEISVSEKVLKGEPGWAFSMPPQLYERDSAYIAITAKTRLGNLWDRPGYTDSLMVDTIFYSPDRLKLFAFIIERKPERKNFIESTGIMHSYRGDAYVGFRYSVGQTWELYAFDLGLLGTYETPEKAKQVLQWLYFKKLKEAPDFIINEDGKWQEERFGANLGERAFWSSMLWRKGTRAPGLYIFQTYRWLMSGHSPSEQVKVKNFESIDYPKDLLEMFKKESEE